MKYSSLDKLLTTDFANTYILGIKAINHNLFNTAYSCIDLLKQDLKSYPDYKPVLQEYIITLEHCINSQKENL